jgi:hypothetical protein
MDDINLTILEDDKIIDEDDQAHDQKIDQKDEKQINQKEKLINQDCKLDKQKECKTYSKTCINKSELITRVILIVSTILFISSLILWIVCASKMECEPGYHIVIAYKGSKGEKSSCCPKDIYTYNVHDCSFDQSTHCNKYSTWQWSSMAFFVSMSLSSGLYLIIKYNRLLALVLNR